MPTHQSNYRIIFVIITVDDADASTPTYRSIVTTIKYPSVDLLSHLRCFEDNQKIFCGVPRRKSEQISSPHHAVLLRHQRRSVGQ